MEHPLFTTKVPLEYPQAPVGCTPHSSLVRTSVDAHPDVLAEGAVEAADDVDGAGGVNHGRVVSSGSPRRVGGAGGPGHACGTNGQRKRTRVRPHVAAEL
jgi:hypothetical protein